MIFKIEHDSLGHIHHAWAQPGDTDSTPNTGIYVSMAADPRLHYYDINIRSLVAKSAWDKSGIVTSPETIEAGVDIWAADGLPEGTLVTCDQQVFTVTDGTFEFEPDIPGDTRITIRPLRFVERTFVIHAT